MRKFQSIVFFAFVFLTQIIYSQVTVEYVTSINDSGAGTLREALASGNDTIIIDIKGVLSLDSSLSLISNTVIFGPSATHFKFDLTNVTNAEGLFKFNGNDLEINGVAFEDGVNGVFNLESSNSNSSLKVNRCLFSQNRLTNTNVNGGCFSVSSTSANVKINACSFFYNESSARGGAIFLNSGTLEVYNSTFNQNQSVSGGAVCAANPSSSQHTISIINNTFVSNIGSQGNDLYLENSDLYFRNNILSNGGDPLYSIGLNTLSTPENNFTDVSGADPLLEYHSDLKLSNGLTTDGYGLKYFTFEDETSPCIDVDLTPTLNLRYDIRRSWRKMIGKVNLSLAQFLGGNGNAVDAGAVEYTPFIITNASNSISNQGSAPYVFDKLNDLGFLSLLNNSLKTIVFELPINDGDVWSVGMAGQSLNVNDYRNDSLIINGYSQNYSRITGPGININNVTPAYIPLQIDGQGGDGSKLIINSSDVLISGLCIVNTKSSPTIPGNAIEISSGYNVSVEGCHIGIGSNGVNEIGNSFGIVSSNSVDIGIRNYINILQHGSRNVISSNDSVQILLNFGGNVGNNFIGLLGDGTSITSSNDIGLKSIDAYGFVNIGGNELKSNYFGKLNKALVLPGGEIYNNYFGFEYDKVTASTIDTAINTFIPDYASTLYINIKNNFFGNINESAIVSNLEFTTIQGNLFGLSPLSRGQAPIGNSGVVINGGASSTSFGEVNGRYSLIGIDESNPSISQSNIFLNCGLSGIQLNLGIFKSAFSEDPPTLSDIPVELESFIKGNYIGVDTAIANANANFGNGVGIMVGDSIYKVRIDSNKIAKNIGAGVSIEPNSKFNFITKNIMYQNGGLGIDLDTNNIANITNITKPQSNDSLIPPEFLNVIYCNTDNSTKLKVRVYIEDYSLGYGIEFYEADVDSQEGYNFKKYEAISPTINGWNTFELAYNSSVTINQQIIATLTMFQDSSLKEISTSEFSTPFTIGDYQPSFSSFEDSICQGDSSYIQISNYGSIQAIINSTSYSSTNDSSFYFLGSTSGLENVQFTIDSLGCSKSIDSSYTVFSLPSVNLGSDSYVCQGHSVVLESIQSGGQWEDLNHDTLGIGNTTVVINTDTAYVYMVSNNGCQNRDTINFYALNSVSDTVTENICFGTIYSFGSQTLNSSGTYTETFLAANGCDSIVTLNLIVDAQIIGVDTQTACDSFTWINGVTYTSNNTTAKDTLTAINGCDSIVTLNLTINTTTTGIDTQISCNSYTWIDGITYTSDNSTATHTLSNSNGCDSIVTLNLTINSSTSGLDTQTACGSYTWIDGITYTSNNNSATHTLTGVNGCDSIVTLNLTIATTALGIDTHISCGDFTWINGVTYNSSNNIAKDTLTSVNGCDSIVTLNLTVNQPSTGDTNATSCNDYLWYGNTYSSSGDYTHTLTSSNGCDSVVTLHLIINTSVSYDTTVVICGGPYDWNGVSYASSGTYNDTFTTVNGCDSIVTLNLTIGTVTPEIPDISGPINYCQDGDNSVVDIEPNNLGLEHSFLYNGLQHDFVDENIFFGHLDIEDDTIGFFVNSNGCYGDTLYLDINLIANDYTVGTSQVDYCEGDSIVFIIEGNSFDSIQLKYNAILNSYLNNDSLHIGVGDEGEYEFYISKSGCTFKDSLMLIFDNNCGKGNVVTTTAFSPNGDLIENTTFNIDLDYINQGLSNVVTIYNRWGDVIYKVNDYKNEDNAWHGENQSGDSMPEGTYFYVVEVPSKNFSTSGWIYLDLK